MNTNWRDHRDAVKERVRRVLERRGYRLERLYPRDLEHGDAAVARRVRPFTMTSVDAVAALCAATRHVVRRDIPGAFVECGVWRGGSMMAVALTLAELGARDRDLYLFDTFAGMPPPTEHDVRVLDGLSADRPETITPAIAVGLEEVRAAMATTGYPPEHVHLVPGRVEDTVPLHAPGRIALLRLDTDWYESTRHELEHLYPRLAAGGFLVVDDYGHWAGSRKAVDEYLDALPEPVFLSRVDYTVRLAVKPAGARP